MSLDLEQMNKDISSGLHKLFDERKQRVIQQVKDADNLPEHVVPKVNETPAFDGKRSEWDHEKKEWKQLFKVVLCYKEGTANKPVLQSTCKACPHRDGRYCTSKDHILNLHVREALEKDRRELNRAFNRTFCKR
jgi:hypothetical protein